MAIGFPLFLAFNQSIRICNSSSPLMVRRMITFQSISLKNVFKWALSGQAKPSTLPRGATGKEVLFSGCQKLHLSGYCRIKFQLMMLTMIVIIVIILMIKMTNNQTNTITFWSKYTSFKHYFFGKKGPNKQGRGRDPPPLFVYYFPFKLRGIFGQQSAYQRAFGE